MSVLLGQERLAIIKRWPYQHGDHNVGFHCTIEDVLYISVCFLSVFLQML